MGEIWYDNVNRQESRNRFWWRENNDTMHDALFGLVKTLRDEQKYRERANLYNVCLYGNAKVMGLDAESYASVDNYEEHMTYNVIESAIDTIHADIIANRGRVMFLTDGGKFEEQRRAKGLTQFIDGQFYHNGMHTEVAPMALLDAIVLGTGHAKNFIDPVKRQPAVERVFSDEILVDDAEARDGNPRQMFHVKPVPREKVIQTWGHDNPALREKLRLTKECLRDGVRKRSITDIVEVVEAWHLPSADIDDESTDRDARKAGGVHCIAVENTVIMVKPLRKQYFPLTPLRYKRRNLGYWGKGVGEILGGAQIGINELLWKIHQSLKLAGPKVFVNPGSQLNTAHLDNEIWGVIETLEPPHMAVFESVPPDLFRQLLQEIQHAYELVGVNMMSAQGGLPPGLEGGSGRALRIYSDTKSKRFVHLKQNFEQWHIDIATKQIDITRDLQRDSEPYEVLAPAADGTAKLLKWDDVDLPADKYIMQAFPTSFLSTTPSSRIRDIEDLLKIAPQLQEHVFQLFDFPDLKAVSKLLSSETEIARMFIERILYEGEDLAPEPFMRLAPTLELARRYYLQGRLENAPEENLEKLRTFMVTIEGMLAQSEAKQAPPPGPPPGAPPGGPMPPPGAPPPGAPPGPMPPPGPPMGGI